MNKRAAIYARVSRAYKESDERVTIESQLNACKDYCDIRGFEIVAKYIDKDRYRVRGKLQNPSGTRKDRPDYRKMLKDASEGKFEVIIAWKEDRLYRGMYAAMPLSELLDNKRILTVELVVEKFDLRMLGINAAIGKIEIDNIRDRMVMGRKARIERGEVPGGPTRYGYDKGEKNLLVINESEANIIQLIFDLYNQGQNNMEIRRRLNAMNIKPRKSKLWSKSTIQRILTFEGYASGQYSTTLDGQVFSIPCPLIISKSVWQKALETRETNKAYRGRNVKEDHLCRGMVVCMCGWKWTARTSHASKKYIGKWGYYGCAKKDHKPEEAHPLCAGTIGSKKLDGYVWDFFASLCRNPEQLQHAIDLKVANLMNECESIEDEADALLREIDQIDEERHWVITMARKEKISEDDMDMQLGALEFQTLDLKKKRDEKLAAIALQEHADNLKTWADQYLNNITSGLRVLDTDLSEQSIEQRENLYSGLDASRFEDKYDGDQMAALKWAVLEEKRRILRLLVEEVLVVKGPKREKKIIPQLAFDVPAEFASLVYDHHSLAYVEQARGLAD